MVKYLFYWGEYRILLDSMKIKQTLVALTLSITALCGVFALSPVVAAADCGGAKTAIIQCAATNDTNKGADVKGNAIWQILILVLNIMTAGVGILAVGGIAYGTVLYTSAGDKADQVKKAKDMFVNVAIGLLVYGLMYSVLNFLIPGGLFN
jgi:hypothetical protein